ncbi:MAG: hypothetical protein WDN06_14315 [Asticcacaulis sp.]
MWKKQHDPLSFGFEDEIGEGIGMVGDHACRAVEDFGRFVERKKRDTGDQVAGHAVGKNLLQGPPPQTAPHDRDGDGGEHHVGGDPQRAENGPAVPGAQVVISLIKPNVVKFQAARDVGYGFIHALQTCVTE